MRSGWKARPHRRSQITLSRAKAAPHHPKNNSQAAGLCERAVLAFPPQPPSRLPFLPNLKRQARGGRPNLRPGENGNPAGGLAGLRGPRALARRPLRNPRARAGSGRDTRSHKHGGRRSSRSAERAPLPGVAGSFLAPHPRGS